MKLIYYIYIIILLSHIFCTSNLAIKRDIIPVETIEAEIIDDKCAFIIGRNFDIALEEINYEQLENILKNSIFIKKGSRNKFIRIPKLIFFKITLENTGDIPLEIGEIKLNYDNTDSAPLSADYLTNKYNYTALNYNEILSLFKFDTEELCNNDIDFKTDIVKYKGGLVQSGDKVVQIIAFDWIPVQIRKFKISIEIKSDIYQKIIDFKLMRFEYRQSGKYFTKPEKDDN